MYTIQNDNYVLSRYPFLLLALLFLSLMFVQRKKGIEKAPFILSVFTALLLDWAIFMELWAAEDSSRLAMRSFMSAFGYALRPLFAYFMCIILESNTKRRWLYAIPFVLNAILSFLSISNGWVFHFNENYEFVRGPLGLVPFIVPGLYFVLFGILLHQYSCRGHRQNVTIIIVAYIGMVAGILLDTFLGGTTIPFCAMSCIMFIYIHLSTGVQESDDLTGLSNRNIYYADCEYWPDTITAIAMLDMNGLKIMNDTKGHQYGDAALAEIGRVLLHHSSVRVAPYRLGGDEFCILFRKTGLNDVNSIINAIRADLKERSISVAIGYSYRTAPEKAGLHLLRTSADNMMYEDKKDYHSKPENDRRNVVNCLYKQIF